MYPRHRGWVAPYYPKNSLLLVLPLNALKVPQQFQRSRSENARFNLRQREIIQPDIWLNSQSKSISPEIFESCI